MPKKESIEDLERQKEDIENLLSSLEAGFTEGSIPEEHYNEVKQKNTEKLDDIKRRISDAEKQIEKESQELVRKEAEKEAQKAEKAQKSKPEADGTQPAEKEEKRPGIIGELSSRISGEKKEIDEERLKEKLIMEFSPKLEKINVKLVKLKAFVDALKDDKTSDKETTQRVTEEMGEMRSGLSSVEGRLSEMEIKLEDASDILADIKPQRFSKELQKKEEEIKMHDARLEKLDDMNSAILKRVNQIQIILEKLGNIESIAQMTKDLSKKMVSIDDREKRITRLADKIDSMFVEINKRLEEFMFYKAKQDSLDDLSKEMLKSLDELGTKLTRYAEKDDMELLRDTLENKINTVMKESFGPASVSLGMQQDRSEIESLMKLLDDQFKKGQMSKKDYEKAKQANLQKLKEMGEQKEAPAALQPAEEIREETPSPPEEESLPEEPADESGLEHAAKIAQASPEPAIPKEEKAPARAERPAQKKAAAKEMPSQKPAQQATLPQERPAKPMSKKDRMLSDLEYSFRQGLISQKAYDSTRRIIMAKRF